MSGANRGAHADRIVGAALVAALFRALGELEARRLDVLLLFFKGTSVFFLVFAPKG